MSCILEKWLLVQWNNGERDVVNVKHLVNQDDNLRTGCPLNLIIKGKMKMGTLIARCNDRRLLEQMVGRKEDDGAGPSKEPEEVPFVDYSSSGSSWVPSGDDDIDSDENDLEEGSSDTNRRQYTIEIPKIKRKVLTPSHRANAVIPKNMHKTMKNTTNNTTNNITNTETASNRSLINVFSTLTALRLNNATVDINDIFGMRECFYDLFKMVKNMKDISLNKVENDVPLLEVDNISDNGTESDESIDSIPANDTINDNNKENVSKSNVSKQNNSGTSEDTTREWVPIGSGKTLIHKDNYRKVNWKSFTIATRTLLLAAFTRRTLATHSMTGKKSPAFQNKPAKMCLDPKIVSDILIEITRRFKVKENLVRTIITTKCADECKMYKARLRRKKLGTLKEENENKENKN